MGKHLNKNHVLDRVKEAYKLQGNSALARFLEVAPNTITNWYNRVTIDYDKILTKCVNINLEWLLYGKGKPFIQPKITEQQTTLEKQKDYKKEYIDELKNRIELQNNMIVALQNFIEDKEKTIEGLKSGTIIYRD